ncbi:hypothetical protein [Thalassospira marina]|uniref:DUF4432 domain-containing protein n=1 Tax=Thalassospira marina TaxID=2048283 RepID=A0A2N3KTE1_9PROT|nr:hypothetical protein [Thalassospira marina]PKR53844.1 hypothetical protein COO20_12615 [Thalassospira marina]
MAQATVLTLENDAVSLCCHPGFGGRISHLTDRQSGRNWLIDGTPNGDEDTGPSAIYGENHARGWDECFPAIASDHTPYWGPIRDHGLLWGETHQSRITDNCLQTAISLADGAITFERSLTLHGSTIIVDYNLANQGTLPCPYLWSQHCLLATRPGEKLVLDGLGTPDPAIHAPYDDLIIRGREAQFAQKTYAALTENHACIGIKGDAGGILFSWRRAEIPWCGIWLDYGGWPNAETSQPAPHQVALEPATAPFDPLTAAQNTGYGRVLVPGQSQSWQVIIKIFPAGKTLNRSSFYAD